MTQAKLFADWFRTQNFKHFHPDEFTSYFAKQRNGVTNSVPPEALWKNILPTLRVADCLRDAFGKPCSLLSSYRSPAYNRAVGGVSGSMHLQFNALDLTVEGASAKKVFDWLHAWRDAGSFTGGLGLYPTSGFVHIDTRGNNATWSGR